MNSKFLITLHAITLVGSAAALIFSLCVYPHSDKTDRYLEIVAASEEFTTALKAMETSWQLTLKGIGALSALWILVSLIAIVSAIGSDRKFQPRGQR